MGSTALRAVAALCSLLAATSSPLLSQGDPPLRGQDIYRAACANCHGADGTGAPERVVGFPEPLPDFTDCSFASREPAADWASVVHQGGPVRAFSRRMPAFGAALSRDEIDRVVAYVHSLCTDRSWPRGELNLPRPLVTEKAFPEDETVFTASASTARDAGALSASVIYERRIGPRLQWELIVPVGVRERAAPSDGWTGPQIGDVALALKHATWHSGPNAIVSTGLEAILPTGRTRDGFGKGTTVFEPFVAAARNLPRDAFVQAHAGVELPVDPARAEREWFARLALGITVGSEFGRAFSPMVEVVSSGELESGSRAVLDWVPQMQVSLSKRQHILFNAGVRLPLTEREGRKPVFLTYLLWDWFDGGFFDGW